MKQQPLDIYETPYIGFAIKLVAFLAVMAGLFFAWYGVAHYLLGYPSL